MSSKTPKAKVQDEPDETTDTYSETSERKEHRKKKHGSRVSRKTVPSAPPGSTSGDGGLNSRMFGVPGSTPGCTAGAYATEINPDDLPEINFASCFPEHAEAGKDWLAANPSASALSLLLSKWGPDPSLMDRMNKWLIRRVGRKCAEGTEEGRKDMASFAAEAIKCLRSLPTLPEATKLYRAVPWKAMGKLAPGMSEFCEESNIVWPTFTSLIRSEKRARELLKDEGGFLYVIEASQARDVTALAPVQSGADEIMLEPNSQFVITSNDNQGKIFVVGMKQEVPSLRPIMKEVDTKKHHHHRHHTNTSPLTTSVSVSGAPAVVPTVHVTDPGKTSVVVKAPPSPSSNFATTSSRMFASQIAMRPSGSRLSMPSFVGSRRGSITSRPFHRSHAELKSDSMTMTMWSAGKAYLEVHSVNCRGKDKIFKLKNLPRWAEPSAEPQTPATPASPTTPSELTCTDTPKTPCGRKAGKSLARSDSASSSDDDDDMLVGLCADPGFGSMLLYPNQAPTYIITADCANMRTLAGIAPSVFLNRVRRNQGDLV